MLFSTAAATRCASISSFWCAAEPAACICVMPPRLLQLANGRTAIMWRSTTSDGPERAARLFGGVSRRSSVLPMFRDELHWLPIKQRIYFKVGIIFFKAMNGLAPSYLAEMFVPISSNLALRQNRSTDRGDLIIQKVKTISYRRRSFAIAGPSFWNSLPMHLRSSPSLTEFKTNLKTYLFREAYNL